MDTFSLGAGESLAFVMRLKVDPQLDESRELCAQAILIDQAHREGEDEGDGSSQSELRCVEGEVVFGSLSGHVFQDLNEDGEWGEEDLVELGHGSPHAVQQECNQSVL